VRAELAIVVALAACRHGAAPPPPPSCEQAADHVLSLLDPKDDGVRAVRGVFATRCREDAWTVEVRSCVMSTTSLKDPKHCKAKLPPPVRAHLETDLAAVAAAANPKDVPAPCREYARMVEKLMTCDKISQAARDAVRESYDVQRQVWTKGASDASIEGCRPAAEAMKQAAVSVGCSLL
jgi:hypothetical protein